MIKLRTKSGRMSKSQKWQMIATILQGVNVSAFVAFGFPAEYVGAAAMLLTIAQSLAAMRLRTITGEPM